MCTVNTLSLLLSLGRKTHHVPHVLLKGKYIFLIILTFLNWYNKKHNVSFLSLLRGTQSDESSTGRFEPDHVAQARPSATDEEEMQLQLALRMSKEQAEEDEKLR